MSVSKSDTKRRPLTLKQQAFVNAYLETGVQQEAYKRAYDCEGMNDNAIHVEASRLMDNPTVALQIAERQAKYNLNADNVLQEMAEVGFAKHYKTPTAGEKVRALELAGRHLGLFKDRDSAEVTITHELTGPLADLTTEEIRELLASKRPQLVEGSYREADSDETPSSTAPTNDGIPAEA